MDESNILVYFFPIYLDQHNIYSSSKPYYDAGLSFLLKSESYARWEDVIHMT